LIGSAAICGLPPLNGFISELLLAGSSLSGVIAAPPQTAIAGLIVLASLGLIGGLAAATFSKAFGIVFLGQPRAPLDRPPHEAGPAQQAPMIVLALGCVGAMLGASVLLRLLAPLCGELSGFDAVTTLDVLRLPVAVLATVSVSGIVLAALVAVIVFVRGGLLAGRKIGSAPTWGCGYPILPPRVQYTGSSFVQPITHLVRRLLGVRCQVEAPDGVLPARASLATETPDLCHGNLYRPGFLKVNWGLSKLRGLQQGQVQLYVLYIALTLIVLLAWKFR
jgi:NADH:ubiquinone oxidoreductase subunit 5 (subunit L)/multisubunit Na+/H+ antiporter MnhA subunit